MFPISYTNTSNDAKSTFKSHIPFLVRSIAKNMDAQSEATVEKYGENIKFYGKRMETLLSGVEMTAINNTKFSLSGVVTTNYDLWSCTSFGDECVGVYAVVSWVSCTASAATRR